MFLLAFLGLAGSLWAADPIIGTWNLNLAKSSPSTDDQDPKERTEVCREVDDDLIELVLGNTFAATSAEVGAYPLLMAATSEEVQGGDYVGPGRFGSRSHPKIQSSNDKSYDPERARKLWEISEQMTGIKVPV